MARSTRLSFLRPAKLSSPGLLLLVVAVASLGCQDERSVMRIDGGGDAARPATDVAAAVGQSSDGATGLGETRGGWDAQIRMDVAIVDVGPAGQVIAEAWVALAAKSWMQVRPPRMRLLASAEPTAERLIVGGSNSTGTLASAHLYDPESGTFADGQPGHGAFLTYDDAAAQREGPRGRGQGAVRHPGERGAHRSRHVRDHGESRSTTQRGACSAAPAAWSRLAIGTPPACFPTARCSSSVAPGKAASWRARKPTGGGDVTRAQRCARRPHRPRRNRAGERQGEPLPIFVGRYRQFALARSLACLRMFSKITRPAQRMGWPMDFTQSLRLRHTLKSVS